MYQQPFLSRIYKEIVVNNLKWAFSTYENFGKFATLVSLTIIATTGISLLFAFLPIWIGSLVVGIGVFLSIWALGYLGHQNDKAYMLENKNQDLRYEMESLKFNLTSSQSQVKEISAELAEFKKRQRRRVPANLEEHRNKQVH